MTDSELLDRFDRRLAGIEPDVRDGPARSAGLLPVPTRRARSARRMSLRWLAWAAVAGLAVFAAAVGLPGVVGLVPPSSMAPGAGDSDWRLEACFAYQPGVTILESFEVEHVSDLFLRMEPWDRSRIGPGTEDRKAFVARLEGILRIEQPRVGPLPGHTYEQQDPTCLLVLAGDGTLPEGEVPLYLGPLR